MSKITTALRLLRTPDAFLDVLIFRMHWSAPFKKAVFGLCDVRDRQFRRRWGMRSLPSASLRFMVCGSVNPRRYILSGRASVRGLEEALAHAGKRLGDFQHILDFGCGVGRMLHFVRHMTRARLCGCDVDADAIAFCRASFPGIGFEVNPRLPPSSYPDSSFDLVYLHSIFTHINEAAQLAWLAEFARVMKPAGLLLISVHGPTFWATLDDEHRHAIERDGHLYLEEAPGQPDGAFHTPQYIERTWSEHFEVEAYLPERFIRQDVAILRRA